MEYQMKLIVGLGNPTPQYDKTRHNVGFAVIDHLMNEYGIALDTAKHKGFYGKGTFTTNHIENFWSVVKRGVIGV